VRALLPALAFALAAPAGPAVLVIRDDTAPALLREG
jgi:hypothetical protein